ncbi:MAG: hypothetical protein IKZ34_00790 [Alphaproteobacteria bacterium]|nr:hypothetical protein [Alphaproteobacteria bacterium]
MKKLMLAICLALLSVSQVFAKTVVSIYDEFNVSATYLVVSGYSEQEINKIMMEMFKKYHHKFDENKGVFELSLYDLVAVAMKSGLEHEKAQEYALKVLGNAMGIGGEGTAKACDIKNPRKLEFVGTQNMIDNEFLYKNLEDFGEKVGFECDGMGAKQCAKDDIIKMPAGHFFKGEKISAEVEYRCNSSYPIGDSWVPIEKKNHRVGACGVNYVRFEGIQRETDNEYLYENNNVFLMVKNNNPTIDNAGKDEYQDLPGKVWECDNKWCSYGIEVVMRAGHVFRGNVVNTNTTYKCNGDNWEPVANSSSFASSNHGFKKPACGVNYVLFKGTQGKTDNEYLYENSDVFRTVKNNNPTIDNAGKDEYQDLPGKVWECDNEWCLQGKEVVMPAGHVFRGNVVNTNTTYKCNGDNWEPVANSSSFASPSTFSNW